jgi:hypothetical protein
MAAVTVYLEVGKKRTLAGALDWPGWCRGGRDEEAALQALIEYGPRYERVLRAAGLSFEAPADASALSLKGAPSLKGTLTVIERLEGNSTTDFGAPDVAPSADDAPVDDGDLQRLQDLLRACWAAFDTAMEAAHGKELRKGPRGGGRDPEEISEHVLGAEASYLSSLGGKVPGSRQENDGVSKGNLQALRIERQRQTILDTLAASARGEVPAVGPRGGARWTPRYFVRRSAWHILDHVWEIEDRVL